MKRLYFFILFLFLNGDFALADNWTRTEIDLYPNGIPGEISHATSEYVGRQTVGDQSVVAVDKPELTMVAPQPEARTGAAVLIMPGGGYQHLAIDKEGFKVAERFAEAGVTAFVLKYRMPLAANMDNPSTGPLQDAQQAMTVIRKNAEKWGLNNERIGVMGFSAGGHLASTVATHFKKPVQAVHSRKGLRPDFQVLIYPVVSMTDGVTHEGSRTSLLGDNYDKGMIQRFSAEMNVTTNTPPAFIVHANDDKAVPVTNALNYHRALVNKRVPVQMLLLPDGGHGFGMRHPIDWFETMLSWMKAYGMFDEKTS
ncbi:alpha/beta hydrolase [Alteromonas confluentis]|uniref:BD-FAE-like domain-containing protein n=1 Tax=Alteromonas confluentis TaxID=1656094 RepID=A0A1E7Z8N7_9ALTE|nr:alpha/beta hydrolase [Alteromonas confluentis]OFC69913.1 hypothetical protein BFC18_00280 [Alteromonas confluentis]